MQFDICNGFQSFTLEEVQIIFFSDKTLTLYSIVLIAFSCFSFDVERVATKET